MKSGSPSRTTAAHKTQTNIPGLVLSRLPLLSLLLLFLPKLLRGTRDRWVAQVSFIIIYSTGLAPFPRLSAPPHSSQSHFHNIDFHTTKTVTHHPGLHFPSSIALITFSCTITCSPESYYTHYITPTQIQLKLWSIVITLLVVALYQFPIWSFV